MRPSPTPRSTSSSKPSASGTRSDSRANRVLQDKVGYLLKRPVGRPPHEVRRSFASFGYQAQSWTKPRRVVVKVEWHPGELYPGSASSSPIWRGLPSASSPSTTSAARRSSTSRKARSRSNGRGCRAAPSPPTPCVSSSSTGIATDVRGNLVADRPAAGAARASVKVWKADTTGKRQKRCALMQANQRVSTPGRGLLAASTASRARNARFTVAEDAGKGDPRLKASGIRGISGK